MSDVLCEVDASTLKKWLDEESVTLIDVREYDEFAEKRLAGAQLFPVSDFDPEGIPVEGERRIVFYCRSGRRSSIAAVEWAHAHGLHESYSLKGGLTAWEEHSLPITVD